jgi:hypothetical protein
MDEIFDENQKSRVFTFSMKPCQQLSQPNMLQVGKSWGLFKL